MHEWCHLVHADRSSFTVAETGIPSLMVVAMLSWQRILWIVLSQDDGSSVAIHVNWKEKKTKEVEDVVQSSGRAAQRCKRRQL